MPFRNWFYFERRAFIHLKANEETLFKYTDISMGGKSVIGTFVTKCRCGGHFFGVIDGYDAEIKVWTKEAISEMLKIFLRDVYDCNNEEMNALTYSWKNGTGLFICNNFNDAFRHIDINTC